MQKNIGVAEVKKHFSEVVNEVSMRGKHFVIERKGKPVAALVSLQELEFIEKERRQEKGKGLLAALGAWEDFKGLGKVVDDIYSSRRKSKDRKVEGFI